MYNPDIHNRKSIRLDWYDYTQAWLYFITISVKSKLCLFWEITNDEMLLSDAWEMVVKLWLELEKSFPHIHLHDFVVMPNHFHWIVKIKNGWTENRVNTRFTPTGGKFEYSKQWIPSIMQAFKSKTTYEYTQWVYNLWWPIFNKKLWQKDFYEHIIRNEESYLKITEYIKNNPLKWDEDTFYYTEV